MNKFLLFSLILVTTPLVSQSWTQQTDIPSGRHHPITFTLDGKGYSVTGTSSIDLPTKDVYDYDPLTDSWGTLPDFPGLARSFGIGVVANNKAYLGFGATNSQFLNDLWSFDASDSSWTQLASCDCSSRRHPAMISVGNKIYVGLGDGANGDQNDWWMYRIDSNTWSQIASLPGPSRHHPFMFNLNGDVYAGLGHGGPTVYKDWYKLDTSTNTWTTMNLFPDQARVAGTQFSSNGYGYVLSGDGQNHSYMQEGEMWRYDPNSDSWTELPPHPGQSRWAPGSFVINEEVYFFGGYNRFTGLYPTDLWKFSLSAPFAGEIENEEIFDHTFVYPNPASNQISWKTNDLITNVKLINSLGQLFFSGEASLRKIDVSDLKSGLYLMLFYQNDHLVKTSKLMISK